MNPNRKPAGTSAGGQFASGSRPESTISLDSAIADECHIEMIPLDEIGATDLREQARSTPNALAASFSTGSGEEGGWALFDPDSGRIGVAWGADATWFDADGIEDGIAAYFAAEDESHLPR